MSEEAGNEIDWGEVAGQLVHPVKMECIEAFDVIKVPLCIEDLFGIFAERFRETHLHYHVRHLVRAGVAVVDHVELRDGKRIEYYRLADRPPERWRGWPY